MLRFGPVVLFRGADAPSTAEETRFCREYWSGDSRDGQFTNGDGYHYFHMRPDGFVLDAYEYYETDDGEERATRLAEFIGLNWFETFGFEDDELLEAVTRQEFEMIRELVKVDEPSAIVR
jgi:hypothetical protein